MFWGLQLLDFLGKHFLLSLVSEEEATALSRGRGESSCAVVASSLDLVAELLVALFRQLPTLSALICQEGFLLAKL